MNIKRILPALAALILLPVSSLADPAPKNEPATPAEEKIIRALIDDLVITHPAAKRDDGLPPLSPGIDDNDDQAYKRQFEKCQKAYDSLLAWKAKSLPFLVAALKDERTSIPFRNHYPAHAVGDACYWNIYAQLQDRPDDYSEYGYQRTGRDGEYHPKPYWEGTPFDEAGGPAQWLEANKALSYPEMQVKCLTWLLDREKAIGAPDADSYFLNILPLEIRILERRAETGADVKAELQRLRHILKTKDATAVPKDLLPPAATKPAPTAK